MSMKTSRRRCVAWGNYEEKENQRKERGREWARRNELLRFYTGLVFALTEADTGGLIDV